MYSLGDLMSYGGSSSRSVDAPVSVAGLIIGLLLGLGGITLFVLYLIKAIKTRKTLMIVGASLGIVGCGLLIPAIIGIASSIKNHWSEIGELFTGVSAPVITLMRLWCIPGRRYSADDYRKKTDAGTAHERLCPGQSLCAAAAAEAAEKPGHAAGIQRI